MRLGVYFTRELGFGAMRKWCSNWVSKAYQCQHLPKRKRYESFPQCYHHLARPYSPVLQQRNNRNTSEAHGNSAIVHVPFMQARLLSLALHTSSHVESCSYASSLVAQQGWNPTPCDTLVFWVRTKVVSGGWWQTRHMKPEARNMFFDVAPNVLVCYWFG